MASTDVLLADAPGREKILKEKLERLQGRYDYIMIDNPPSLSLLSINSLVASENFIVTVSPAFLSLVGLQSLLETVEVIKKNMNLRIELLGILSAAAHVTGHGRRAERERDETDGELHPLCGTALHGKCSHPKRILVSCP